MISIESKVFPCHHDVKKNPGLTTVSKGPSMTTSRNGRNHELYGQSAKNNEV